MLDIKADQFYLNVNANSVWDQTANNHQGAYKLEVEVGPGLQLTGMDSRILTLETQIAELITQQKNNETLRKEHPAAQDAWDKYQMVIALVEKHTENEGADGG